MIKRFQVRGHSMEPAIEAGQQFFVSKAENFKVGDIIILRHPQKEMFLVKRVKEELENGNFLAEGDNTGHTGEFTIEKKQIVGKLTFCYWPPKKIGFVKN